MGRWHWALVADTPSLSNCCGYRDRLGIISGNNSSLLIFVIPGWSPQGGWIYPTPLYTLSTKTLPLSSFTLTWASGQWKKNNGVPFPVVLALVLAGDFHCILLLTSYWVTDNLPDAQNIFRKGSHNWCTICLV